MVAISDYLGEKKDIDLFQTHCMYMYFIEQSIERINPTFELLVEFAKLKLSEIRINSIFQISNNSKLAKEVFKNFELTVTTSN